jgi:PhnB protein
MKNDPTFFAPELHIPPGTTDISFYINGLGAEELRRFSNDDGSIHVSELSISGALFHLHESKPSAGQFTPAECSGVTAIIGLFVPDVHSAVIKALAAGALLINPVQDYDYGYRQATIEDRYGHRWQLQQKIS